MKQPHPRFVAALAALVLMLCAVTASAQYQTGNLYGRVVSKDGSALPGVTVILSGVGAPQTTVTDDEGAFRFISLSPGTYSLKAELAGMGTAVRSGVSVTVGGNADVMITLNPAVQEAITVMAEAPLLDVRKTGTGANVGRVELEQVPTARDPWMILQSTPGVQVDRINIGGTQSGQQSIYISKGAPRSDGTWNIDGVNITDMGATGSSPTYYDFDTFEELNITTGGSDPRIQTAGVQLNMVTKRGTNDIKGSGRYLYVPGSTSAEATVPDEAKSYLKLTNRVNYVRDYGGEVGGPIIRDRLWLWVARGDQKISTWQSQLTTTTFIIPDDTILRNKNAKMNAQLFANNSFVASYTFGDKFRNARDLSPQRPFESAWKQTGPTEVYKIEDTHVFNSNFYLTAMWSKVEGGFGLFANGGVGPEAPSYWVDAAGNFHDNYFTYQTVRPQKQYRLDGSAFVDFGVNHEFKFGFGYRDTPVSSATSYPGPASGFWSYQLTTPTTCVGEGLPENCAVATLFRPPRANYSGEYKEFYVGDTVMIGNLTLQAGLRWDDQSSRILPMSIDPNPILASALTLPCARSFSCTGGSLAAQLPGLEYPGQDEDLQWTSISPRLGLTYALGEQRQTILRASYNRYVSQLGSTVAGSSPVGSSSFTFFGVDANNNRTIERSELSKVRSAAGINPANPTAIASTRRIDYDMNPPTTDELVLGADRELMRDFVVGLTFTHRRTKDLAIIRYEKTQGRGDWYTAADFVDSGYVAGGSFRGGTTGTTRVFALRSGLATPLFSVITNRPDYEQTFNGLELTATKRMSNDWMLRFNAAYNDYVDDCGGDAFANPTPGLNSTGIVNGAAVFAGPPACPGGQIAPQSAGSGAFGNVFINARWTANLNGVYVFPWQINLGWNVMARQGYPAVLRENVLGLNGGTVGVVLDPLGEIRFPNVYQLDLRLAKDFRIMNMVGLTLSADVFNATNQRTVLQRETLVRQFNPTLTTPQNPLTPAGWNITELQAPRVWRFGAKITY